MNTRILRLITAVAFIALLTAVPALAAGEYLITWLSPPKSIDTSLNVRIDFLVTNPLQAAVNDTVTVFFGTQTGGGNLANYPYCATQVFRIDTASLPAGNKDTLVIDTAAKYGNQALANIGDSMFTRTSGVGTVHRSIFISPRYQMDSSQNKTMTVGRYYFVVVNRSRTKVSQEGQMIIETKQPASLVSPASLDTITNLLPVFKWTPVPGVPYYHLLLSDQPIDLKGDTIQGASFIWQAITPGSQIQYGLPDPSGVFPDPPPLTPNKTYQWLVLNNYGNQKEYTSLVAQPVPFKFITKGDLGDLYAPDTAHMTTLGDGDTLHSFYEVDTLRSCDSFKVGSTGGQLRLQWAACTASTFNIYKVYIYNVVYDSTTGSNAAITVWTTTTLDTGVTLDARSFLASGVLHEWKVFVENTNGAGLSSRKRAFYYEDTAAHGGITYLSKELIGNDTLALKFANVSILPLQGGGIPIDLPTDANGYGHKTVQYGTYRVLMNPKGYYAQESEVAPNASHPDTTLNFVLRAYPCQVTGFVKDSGNAVSDATLRAQSQQGGTDSIKTDASGGFTLRLPPGDWVLAASKEGYQRSTEKTAALDSGDALNLGNFNIQRFTNIISGVLTNASTGGAIISAEVSLSRNGVFLELTYTAFDGSYTFAVAPGSGYVISFRRAGFSTFTSDPIALNTNVSYNAQLSSDIGIVAGITRVVMTPDSTHFVSETRADVPVVAINAAGDTAGTGVSSKGDNTYSLSLPAGTYTLHFSGNNIVPDSLTGITVTSNAQLTRNALLREYGRITGTVHALLGTANQPVTVTVQGGVLALPVTAVTEPGSGRFTVNGLLNGAYTLTYACGGFTQQTAVAVLRDTVIHYGADSVHCPVSVAKAPVTLARGTLHAYFKVSLLDSVRRTTGTQRDTLQALKITVPAYRSFSYDSLGLDSLGAGLYVFGSTITPPASFGSASLRIMDLDSMGYNLAVNNDTVRIPHPVKCFVTDTATLTSDSVTLCLIVKGGTVNGDSVTAAAVHYRDISDNAYRVDTVYTRPLHNDTLTFRVSPTASNSTMQYYFTVYVTAGGRSNKYSNSGRVFVTHIPPRLNDRWVTLLPLAPTPGSAVRLPYGIRSDFKVICQNGANEIVTLRADSVRWALPSPLPAGITFSGNRGDVITATIARDTAISTTLVTALRCTVTVAGHDTVLTTHFSVIKMAIDTLQIDGNAFVLNAGEQTSFQVYGFNNDSNKLFPALGTWSCDPLLRAPYGMSWDGKFTAPPHSIGTFTIKVSAFGKTTRTALAIRHQAKPGDSTWAQSPDSSLTISFGASVFTLTKEVYLRTTAISSLPVLKTVTLSGSVISPIHRLSFGTSSTENAKDSFRVAFAIPEVFRGKDVFAAVWNQQQTRWDSLPAMYFANVNGVLLKGQATAAAAPGNATQVVVRLTQFGASGYDGEYALLSTGQEFGIYKVKVGPNPFSPFVTARDGDRTWQGARIEFDVSSNASASVSSEAMILNMEGNIVNNRLLTRTESVDGFETLYSLNTNGGFYGNKTLRRVYLWDGTNNHGRLCRNGRYLVRIAIDDGTEKAFKTIPLVLFK
ncbi:MAG: carboxypeptidase-like regulatory domain-containing protein [Fibrobacterota bacterium]